MTMEKAASRDLKQPSHAPSPTRTLPQRNKEEASKAAQEAYENSPRYLVLLDAINLGLAIDDRVRTIAESVEKYDGASCLRELFRDQATISTETAPVRNMNLVQFLNPEMKTRRASSATEDLLEIIDPNSRLPTSMFHFFMKIPKELRLVIWDLFVNAIGPQNIHVTLSTPNTSNKGRSAPRFKTTSSVPAILQICRQSRAHGLRKYTTIFNTTSESGVGRREIYARPTVDTIIVHLPKWMKQCHAAASLFKIRLEYPAGLSSLDFASTASPWSNETHSSSKLSTFAWIDATSDDPCHDLTRNFLVIHPRRKADWSAETIDVDTSIQSVQDIPVPVCWDGFWTAFCHGLEIVSPGARCGDRCTGCVKQPWVPDYDDRFWKGLSFGSPGPVRKSCGVRRK